MMFRQPVVSLNALRRLSGHQHFCKFSTASQQQPILSESEEVKPYSAIPGPKGYPLIGTALDYGGENKNHINKVMKQRFDKYGSIYKEKLFPGFPEQVMICDPKDIETVFRADGEWPFRPEGGDVFLKMREEADLDPGILQLQGEAWHDQRMPMSKFMMVPRKVAEYYEGLNGVTEDLISNIYHLRDPDSSMMFDVPNLLFKWSFESVSFFMFGKRLGALETKGNIPPDCKEFIYQTGQLFRLSTELLFSLPLYKIYPTKKWKGVVECQRTVKELAMKFIEEKLSKTEEEHKEILKNGSEEAPAKVDFLTYLLFSGQMNLRGITTNIIDLLTAGVDTTSYTMGWILYNLATNPEAQEKLRSEVQQVMGAEKIVTPAHINQMSYLKSCIKETMRLYPLTGFNQRKVQQDVILSGYSVPAGTEVVMPGMITGRMPELFHDPDCFIPERWNKENKDKLPNMFSSLPFGFGPRMCVGHRLAELEMTIAIAHVINKFRLEYPDQKPMGYIWKFLLVPERQLNLSFQDI